MDVVDLKRELRANVEKYRGKALCTGELDVSLMCRDVLSAIEYLEDTARRWKSMCLNWVSVDDRMPAVEDLDRYGCVLCLDITEMKHVCQPPAGGNMWTTRGGKLIPVSHWVSMNSLDKDLQEEYRKLVSVEKWNRERPVPEAAAEPQGPDAVLHTISEQLHELKQDMCEVKGFLAAKTRNDGF